MWSGLRVRSFSWPFSARQMLLKLSKEGSPPMKKITELTAELAAPAIAEQGCTLWDVEYVKEAGTW